MIRIAVVLAAMLGLSGCFLTQLEADVGLITSATVPSRTALIAENVFGGLETVAVGYLSLPLCSAAAGPACRTTAISTELYTALKAGQTARDNLQLLVQKAAGGPIPVANYNTLQAAIASIKAINKSYGLGA